MKDRYFSEMDIFEMYPELDEYDISSSNLVDETWEAEVNRGSPLYTAWIQQSLNQVMGLKLVVDGDLGKETRSAIRSFQQQNGLPVDGKVGPNTGQQIVQSLNRFIIANPSAMCAGIHKPEILD